MGKEGKEIKNDGSLCPKCNSKNINNFDNEHDIGYLKLWLECHDCGIEYTVTLEVKNNEIVKNEIRIEGGDPI